MEVKMILKKWINLFKIRDESPFFVEISIKERDKLMKELQQTYSQLDQYIPSEMEVGYEASWLMRPPR